VIGYKNDWVRGCELIFYFHDPKPTKSTELFLRYFILLYHN
jgi:hypothetical protein